MMYPDTVIRHGAPFLLTTTTSNRAATGKQEAARIAAQFKGARNVPGIALVACYGANGGAFSNAQMLANAMAKPVMGYYGKITVQGRQASGATADYKVFRPQSRAMSTVCASGNHLFGCIMRVFTTPGRGPHG